MSSLSYIGPSLLRNPRRAVAYLLGTVIAVALLSSVLLFVVGAATALTQRSIAPIHPDMQVVATSPAAGVTGLQHQVAQQAGVAATERFALASFNSARVRAGPRLGQTGSGKIVAMNPSYMSTFGVPSIRQGTFGSSGVVISQDLGTNLGARVGDIITLRFAHLPPQRLRVVGVASMLNTDTLFAPLDPVARLNPFNPPVNVVLMDYQTFERTLKPLLLKNAPPATRSGVVVRTKTPLSEQVHVRLNRSLIPSDPSQAKTYTTNLRNQLELRLTGRATVIDNIAAGLDTAQTDVLWAQVIFVFLALPGVILAAALARYVTATVIDAQRGELALLRIRGIGPRRLLTLLGLALLLVSIVGVVIGLVAGWLTTRLAGGAGAVTGGPLFLRTILIALVAGLLLGAIGTFWPLVGFVNAPVVAERRRVGRGSSPLWMRLYLDVIALIAGIAVYYLTQRNGFQPVLNAEGNPTISLSFFTFLAPLFFWLGAILLLVRLSRKLVSGSGGLLSRTVLRTGVVRGLVSRTLARRAGSLHQVVLLIAMSVAFSSGLITFVHTYNQQQRVDAELTLGSDVRVDVVNSRQSPVVAHRLAVPGVVAVTPFRRTVAYVGTEIQDMFGIDVPSFQRATHVTSSFFVGSTASAALARLQSTPNGIMVSAETERDYSLNLGDTLRLRMRDRTTGNYVPVRFTLVGVVREFATAPKDAFLVSNLAYIKHATHDTGVNTFLIKTSGSPGAVKKTLESRFAAGPTVHVQDLSNVQQQLATSLTSLDLSALSRIDYLYTLIILLTGLVVFALAVLLERGRDFAMLEVVGVTPGQIRGLVLSELGYAVVVGSILGLAVGLGFAQMLIQILTAIFDPPPNGLAVPWSSILLVLGIVLFSGLLAWVAATARMARTNLAAVLRGE